MVLGIHNGRGLGKERGDTAAGSWSQKLRDCISTTQEANRAEWKYREAINS